MANKFGNTVTYLDGLLPIKLHDSSIIWSREITWQPKIIISLLPQCLCPPNLASWWHAMKGFHRQCYSTLLSIGLAISRDKLIIISPLPKYLWPQNWAGWWLTLTAFYLPIKSNDHIITLFCKDHMTNWKHCNSTTTVKHP